MVVFWVLRCLIVRLSGYLMVLYCGLCLSMLGLGFGYWIWPGLARWWFCSLAVGVYKLAVYCCLWVDC